MEKIQVGIPTGAVFPFAGTVEPDGFMFCDGRSLSRAAYPGLFSIIGTAHGAADASSFNIPDYRGRFLRGVDGTAGLDPDKASRTAMKTGGATGNALGSVQGHAFQTHTHIQDAHGHSGGMDNQVNLIGGSSGAFVHLNTQPLPWTGATTATNQNASASGANSQASSGESRPVNAYVNYIIKV